MNRAMAVADSLWERACSRLQTRGVASKLAPTFAAAVLLALAGCETTSRPAAKSVAEAPLVARFFLEAKPSEAGIPVTLPQSGVTVTISPKPVLVEYDITNAEVAQVDLGRCLLVQLSAAASRDLYRLSVSAVGRRLVLSLNDEFLGARRIESAMSDGTVLIFLEVPDERLPEIVALLKSTSATVAEAARKAKK